MAITYRPEIDGLRALAVIPVVAFHSGLSFVPGGFAGVDVFFVISGFLITSMILRELDEERFSIFEFYKRRFLRILPALIVVIIATLLASYFLLLPVQQSEIARSGIYAVSFVSNIYFWRTQDYFRANSIEDPLLHTWSLGVEEQFYIVFPLLLILINYFFRQRFVFFVSLGCLVSFAPLLLIEGSGSAKFYLMPTRFWELGLGALVAMGVAPKLPKIAQSLVCFLALASLIASYAFLSDEDGFVGWLLIVPVCASAALIAYLPQTRIAFALSIFPLRYIGKVSYSMYLWHWPMLSFYFLIEGGIPSGVDLLIYALALFAVSAMSKEFLEDPIRYGWRPWSALRANVTALTSLAVVVLVCLIARDSLPKTVPISREIKSVSDYVYYTRTQEYQFQWRRGKCFVMDTHEQDDPTDKYGGFDPTHCLAQKKHGPNVLVIGDSHSAHIWRALEEKLPTANVMQASSTGCHPLLEDDEGRMKCRRLMMYIFEDVVPAGEIDAIVFAARWRTGDGPLLEDTLEAVNPFVDHVLVLGPTPEFASRVPIAVASRLRRNQSTALTNALDEGRTKIDSEIETSAEVMGAYYVSLMQVLCSEVGGCPGLTSSGAPMQFDYTHFTLPGARVAIERAELLAPDMSEFLSAVENLSRN